MSALLGVSAHAQSTVYTQQPLTGVEVSDVHYMRHGGNMNVEMDVDLGALDVKPQRAVILTPYLVNGSDSLALHSVGIYGRKRYYHYVRNGESMLTGPSELSYRRKQKPSHLAYTSEVPYADWMDGSQLCIVRQDYGCCSSLLAQQQGPLGSYRSVAYKPDFRYVQPVVVTDKSYTLSGRAFIDFPVNRTELHPDYRGNRAELAKIVATIDSVRNDQDITVTSLTIKGFASPEGTYENNVRLAKGRTETLKQYVQQLYRFEPGFIVSDYEAEDWQGLRDYVAGSALEHRSEILAIIDDPALDPDPREWRIKLRYPDDYKVLLSSIYPALRHSDYRITYSVRAFSSPDEIRRIMATAPQKLSLNEMFILAQTLEPGSDEYNDVFETAVRMFPDNETAHLNAANAAMTRGDYTSAQRYLAKAGDGAEAIYARGVLSALRGDYEAAEQLVREAQAKGMADLGGVIEHLQEVRKYAPRQ